MDEDQGTGNVRLEQGKTKFRTKRKATVATISPTRRATPSIRRHAASSKQVLQTAQELEPPQFPGRFTLGVQIWPLPHDERRAASDWQHAGSGQPESAHEGSTIDKTGSRLGKDRGISPEGRRRHRAEAARLHKQK